MVCFFAPANWFDQHVFGGPSPVPIRQRIIKGVLVISNVPAAIEDIHVRSYTSGGSAMQELTADVRNNGIKPIRMVYATVATLNESGSEQRWSDCDIYAAWDKEPGILPGELGRNTEGQGHPFPALLGERFTQITVTGVSSSGAKGIYQNPVADGS
jgi:hypothetical protein